MIGGAFDPRAWADFYVMLGGAAATLMGLVFVALSLHLREILADPWNRGRAASSLVSLAVLLLLAVLFLVPEPSLTLLGTELIVLSLASSLYIMLGLRHPPRTHRARFRVELLAGGLGVGFAVAAGICLLAHRGPGLTLLVPAVALALMFAVWNAWRLMVEVATDRSGG